MSLYTFVVYLSWDNIYYYMYNLIYEIWLNKYLWNLSPCGLKRWLKRIVSFDSCEISPLLWCYSKVAFSGRNGQVTKRWIKLLSFNWYEISMESWNDNNLSWLNNEFCPKFHEVYGLRRQSLKKAGERNIWNVVIIMMRMLCSNRKSDNNSSFQK